jgi:hypothetical protein
MPSFDYSQTVTITELTRVVRLSYLQTIRVLDNSASLNRLAGETSGSQSNSFASNPGSPGFLGIGSEGASSVSTVFSDTGWAISRTWLETWWDKIRWSIGIREIGIFNYRYAETSELVSVPFSSPMPIEKVTLRVDENIPPSYPASQRWIQYFVTPDNGKSWHRINPLDHPTLFGGGDGKPMPRIITFNPDFSEEDSNDKKFVRTTSPVTQVRFRAVFLRPPGESFEGTTPILKAYRMLIYPKGGLLQ